MIIESGFIVAMGLVFTFYKLSWRTRLKMLGYPLAMDVSVFVLLNWLHWGTFSGLMVAATGAMVCSGLISIGRKLFGYIERNHYVRGVYDVHARIKV
jgi:hypothetical protein